MCNAWNHPPGCDCGWGAHGWSGGYGWPSSSGWHSESRESGLSRITHLSRILNWYHYGRQDVCFPTTCPYPGCGEQVYFVRHNDGCVWLDPLLGWPWPKHRHCNSDQDYLVQFFERISRHRHGVEAVPMLGRIVKRIHRSIDLLYLVAVESGQLAVFTAPPNPKHPLTGIVVLRFTEEGLLLEDHHHEPVHVKDAHLHPRVLEDYLDADQFDVKIGWQPPPDPPSRSRKSKH